VTDGGVICPACGHANREAARFCEFCGRRLDADASPATGATAAPGPPAAGCWDPPRPGARAPVSYTPRHLAERVLTEGRALRGERKEVTVLFVDVQGSTELAGALDPEDFHAVLDGAFQLMLDAVHHWEGTVNQFTGDGIMALFGAPIAHEDHARRALHAALEIQRGLMDYAGHLRRERGLAVQARLGLNSGPVVVGAIGDDLRMDYTAQGLTTNLAARMQQAADPGTVLVAAATHRLAEGYFRFRALGGLRVRGVAQPVEAYVLEGEGSVASRLEASLRRGFSPFRGRETELAELGQAWERAQAGKGDAICLVGEPGIGKSRLAFELQRSLGLTHRVEAAALSHTRGAAYFVFRQLLRQLGELGAESDLAASREALRRRLWDLSPPLAERVPGLLSVLGGATETLGSDPGAGPDEARDRVREAVVDWIRAECARRPRVLVVEDLHWLDPSSEQLLAHLAGEAREMPLLVLMTSRLGLAGTRLALAGIREIALGALSTADVEALVDAQLDPYPGGPRLRRVAAARSEGNPFFVEELVRAFREQAQLVLDHGRYELAADAEPAVPPTLTALIAARIDRLPPSARDLLADAATLGMRFPLAHLRGLASAGRVEEDLTLLERRGLLDRPHEGPVATGAFRHVLTHEVVLGSMLQADRQARHRRAAEMLERLYRGRTQEVADLLGHHWVSSDARPRAFPYLLAAADGAVAVGANREAIGHLETALGLATQRVAQVPDTTLAGLKLKLAGLHFIVGER
jgi:class 3 adenylate cyclase